MPLVSIISIIAAALCLGLSVIGWWRSPGGVAPWAFVLGMCLLAIESVFTALAFSSGSTPHLVYWQNLRLWATSLLPGLWLLFSLSYARGNYRRFLATWWPSLAIICLLPLALFLALGPTLVFLRDRAVPPCDSCLALSWPGIVVYSSFLISLLLILMHLERTLRISVGTMRWRIKFMVLGLLLLFAVRIYTASRNLLYTQINPTLQNMDAIALVLACGLIGTSFWRAALSQIDIYPSPKLLQSSFTVLLAGLYLLLVSLLSEAIAVLGGDSAFAFKVFFILLSLVFLVTLFLSERTREYLRRALSRHFQRSHYDYRSVWTTFAEHTTLFLDKSAFCQAVVKWLSSTFNVLSVTIWLVDDHNKKLVMAASTAVPKNPTEPFLQLSPEIIEHFRKVRYPISLDDAREKWVESLNLSTTSFFPDSGKRICLPILGRGEFVGVLTLGDRVNNVPFILEDFDLLKCVGEQVASHLLNIQLSQKLLQVREMEAFQTMAAFFVHDLKNVGSTLSLMLQNLAVHFDNPDFRKDALRSLSRSVAHLNELISRLTLLRQQLELKNSVSNLNEVVASALETVKGSPEINLCQDLQPLPGVSMDSDQIQKVVTNLLLNAVEASPKGGEVRVQTCGQNGWACLSIQDHGSGMTPEFITQSLFRPFQTTKKGGLGIGIFQCKMIVDAHRGKLEVESQPGQGTTFRVLLPLTPETL